MAECKAHLPSTDDHAGCARLAFFSDHGDYGWRESRNTVDLYPMEVQEANRVELRDGQVDSHRHSIPLSKA